jgi:hypothetical protein
MPKLEVHTSGPQAGDELLFKELRQADCVEIDQGGQGQERQREYGDPEGPEEPAAMEPESSCGQARHGYWVAAG